MHQKEKDKAVALVIVIIIKFTVYPVTPDSKRSAANLRKDAYIAITPLILVITYVAVCL